MITTRAQIHTWLRNGEKMGATHVVTKQDTFSYDCYPAYVGIGRDGDPECVEDVLTEAREEKMTAVKEVYDLSKDLEKQLNQNKAWNY